MKRRQCFPKEGQDSIEINNMGMESRKNIIGLKILSRNCLRRRIQYKYHMSLCKNCSGIKDRNGVDLTEAEDIKKRWQECTKELYRKDLHDPDDHDLDDHSPRARHPGM